MGEYLERPPANRVGEPADGRLPVRAAPGPEAAYLSGMLRSQTIRCLLPVTLFCLDGVPEFWWHTDGCRSAAEVFAAGPETAETAAWLAALASAGEELSSYLLSPDGLLIGPETVFSDEEGTWRFIAGVPEPGAFARGAAAWLRTLMPHCRLTGPEDAAVLTDTVRRLEADCPAGEAVRVLAEGVERLRHPPEEEASRGASFRERLWARFFGSRKEQPEKNRAQRETAVGGADGIPEPASSAAFAAYLMRTGELTEEEVRMDVTPFRVGTDRAHVQEWLTAPDASALHAVFTCEDGTWMLTDLSGGRTYVGGQALVPGKAFALRGKETIRFGSSVYRFRLPGTRFS